ncbi:hypothetical protein ACHHYP_16510 [Achlya hypogyna]|uniref:PH domain-containing protein n=1 Tax=Achlya hypogyna TaxID=1202772 RepID=A0A1V9Y6F5_ACHHY|nr:hypothetical protein ACHHYP_16510 [Achlya hypogyna]
MRILAEGDLRKRCATLPLMRQRYCMLLLDDSSGAKPKVLLRSYKSQAERDANVDAFVSSHVVKCVGEWTGKGNLHTYPHAFVLETVQSKLFHCSAPSEAAKRHWMTAIPFAEDGLYALVGVTPVMSAASASAGEAPTPEPVHVHVEQPAVEAPEIVLRQSSWGRQSSAHLDPAPDPPAKPRPPSVRDALFQPKPKRNQRRDLVADLEIESDDDTSPARESLLLAPTVLSSKADPYDDDFGYGQTVVAPPMKLKFEIDPLAPVYSRASSAQSPDNDSDDDHVPLDPELYARYSQMRMESALEASRWAKDTRRKPDADAKLHAGRKAKTKKPRKTKVDDDTPRKTKADDDKPRSKRKSRREAFTPPLPAPDAPLPQPRAVPVGPAPQLPHQGLRLPDIEGF